MKQIIILVFVIVIALPGMGSVTNETKSLLEKVELKNTSNEVTRVISYLPYYKISTVSKEIFEHLTHVNYFSLGTNSAGELGRVNNSGVFTSIDAIPQVVSDLDTLKKWRGEGNTKIFVVLGGWVQSDYFDEMVADDDARVNFIKNVKDLLLNNNVDGADIDWEGYNGAVVDSDYKKLLVEMKQAFEGTKLGLSVAIGKTHTSLADEFMESNVEHIGLMTYGKVFDDGMQVSLNQLKDYVDDWIDAGATKEKLVVGVPFYGRTPSDGSSVTYREIISQYNPANSVNSVEHDNKTYYYNGVDAIEAKANYVKDAGLKGVMIWEQGQDVAIDDEKSLLKTITQVIPVDITTSINREIPYSHEKAKFNLKVFPCPVKDELNVSLVASQGALLTLSIFDSNGYKLKQIQKTNTVNGKQTIPMSLASLTCGMYVLKVNCNDKSASVQIVKL